jgi:hypothetical protein
MLISSPMTPDSCCYCSLCFRCGPFTKGGAIASTGQLSSYGFICNSNTCQGNGGCLHSTSDLYCNNCTISGNTALYNGGGLYTESSGGKVTLEFQQSIIFNNRAQQAGAGCFGGGENFAITYNNTTIADNVAGCCYASGYGSNLSRDSTSTSVTCADLDAGIS